MSYPDPGLDSLGDPQDPRGHGFDSTMNHMGGWGLGGVMRDKYGKAVTLRDLDFTGSNLLDDANYRAWAKQNPGKVRGIPGTIGATLNRMGLHDLSGAMTPAEFGWADARWGGAPSDGPQQRPFMWAGGAQLPELFPWEEQAKQMQGDYWMGPVRPKKARTWDQVVWDRTYNPGDESGADGMG